MTWKCVCARRLNQITCLNNECSNEFSDDFYPRTNFIQSRHKNRITQKVVKDSSKVCSDHIPLSAVKSTSYWQLATDG